MANDLPPDPDDVKVKESCTGIPRAMGFLNGTIGELRSEFSQLIQSLETACRPHEVPTGEDAATKVVESNIPLAIDILSAAGQLEDITNIIKDVRGRLEL